MQSGINYDNAQAIAKKFLATPYDPKAGQTAEARIRSQIVKISDLSDSDAASRTSTIGSEISEILCLHRHNRYLLLVRHPNHFIAIKH